MRKINLKSYLPIIVLSLIMSFVLVFGIILLIFFSNRNDLMQESLQAKSVGPQILASGSVRSATEAVLHFQIAGKLIYLPFKEGDVVSTGQTIASLDTYALAQQLQLAANNYQTSKNSADTIGENQQAGVIEGQQRTQLDTTNKNSYSQITEAQVITDNVKRIVDNNLLAQNSAQINVDLASYTISLASITSPISGILISEDVTTPNINITPATSFTVVDQNAYVFRANVSQDDIPFVTEGADTQIVLTGDNKKILGKVSKIYPAKTTLADGENVYQVDIESSDNALSSAKYNQDGTVTISNKFENPVAMVPAWLVVDNQYVWVTNGNSLTYKKVSTGDTIGGMTEILSGLDTTDRIITNPKYVVSKKYLLF